MENTIKNDLTQKIVNLGQIKGMFNAMNEIENGFVIDVSAVIERYERVTGVDLAEFGLCNMVFNL